MTITFTPSKNMDRTFVKLKSSAVITERGIRKAWFKVGQDVKRRANAEILRKPKGGKTYIIRTAGGRKRRHVASKAGETHANLSGALRRSIEWRVRGDQLDFGYGVVKTAPEYASFVEEGTGRMGARPTLRNAINDTKRNAEQHLRDAVEKEFKR